VAQYLVVGNWKMNTTVPQAVELAQSIRHKLDNPPPEGVEVVLCPPFISLTAVRDALLGSSIKLGAQNAFYEPKGAFTGEISATMLAGLCQFVIFGHSERRYILRENYQMVNQKMKGAFAAGLRPILCVGETLEHRRRSAAEAVVRRQLETGLAGIPNIGGLVIAYEPVWAIGTGVPATPATVVDITGGAIRAELAKLYGEHASLEVPVLYGGSVNADNVAGFVKEPSIQGTLVGGASLDPGQFAKIVRLTAEIKGEG
jgi:triosephosphate isomerase